MSVSYRDREQEGARRPSYRENILWATKGEGERVSVLSVVQPAEPTYEEALPEKPSMASRSEFKSKCSG